MTESPYKILLVEDNAGDVMLIEECLRSAGLQFHLTHCDSVKSALQTIGNYRAGDGKLPDLLLLDYNLPAGDACEVLQASLANPALTQTRKVIITSSISPRESENAIRNGAERVIGKPADLDVFLNELGSEIVKLLRSTNAQVQSV